MRPVRTNSAGVGLLRERIKQDNNMNLYRIAGMAFVAGLALFLLSVLVKLLLVAAATVLLVRGVGGYLMRRRFGGLGRGGWSSTEPISIDNPAYRSSMSRAGFDRRSDVSVITIQ